MIFEEWNIALARFFFNPARAGKRVYLHTTKELLARLSDRNSGFHDFVAAIKNGPESYPRGGMCARALALSEDWRSRNEEFPPYVAYLCLFALAAGHGWRLASPRLLSKALGPVGTADVRRAAAVSTNVRGSLA